MTDQLPLFDDISPEIGPNILYPELTILGSKVLEPIKKLETFPNPDPQNRLTISCYTEEFTCKCPITGQPDFATVRINYIPLAKVVESKSLKLYLWTFRDRGIFHEYAAVEIANDFMSAVQPQYVEVSVEFAPRGGIAIRASAVRTAELTEVSEENEE